MFVVQRKETLILLLLHELGNVLDKNLYTTISCKKTHKNETFSFHFGFHDATIAWYRSRERDWVCRKVCFWCKPCTSPIHYPIIPKLCHSTKMRGHATHRMLYHVARVGSIINTVNIRARILLPVRIMRRCWFWLLVDLTAHVAQLKQHITKTFLINIKSALERI